MNRLCNQHNSFSASSGIDFQPKIINIFPVQSYKSLDSVKARRIMQKSSTTIKINDTKILNSSQSEISRIYQKKLKTQRISLTKTLNSVLGKFKFSNPTKLNININIKNIVNLTPEIGRSKNFKNNEFLNNIPQSSQIERLRPFGNPSQRWKKLNQIFRFASIFSRIETKKMDELDIEKELDFNNIIKIKRVQSMGSISPIKDNSEYNYKILNTDRISYELLRLKYKERMLSLIFEGNENVEQEIDMLFNSNPDKFVIGTFDPKFIFNEHLSNDKTLIYIACQEGRLDIVKIFLKKGLNPFIKTKGMVKESCLSVTARWGYTTLLKYLLKQIDFQEEDIKETLRIKNLGQNILKILNVYLKKYNKKSFLGCFPCFKSSSNHP